MSTITRRRRSGTPEEEPKPERTRSRRSRASDDMPVEERNTPEPRRSRRSRGSSDEEEKAPRGRRQRGSSSGGGWGSYASKRRSTSFADDFKPKNDDEPALCKMVDAEPFAIYNQHWIEEVGKGEKRSFVCYDDLDLHPDAEDKGCPLCEIGDQAKTFTLWNVVDLQDPRKAELKVWNASVTQSDDLQRMSDSHRTSPLNREDLYLEVTRVVKGKSTRYKIEAVKAEEIADDPDLGEDYLLDDDEIAEYEAKRKTDLSDYLKVDSWEDLDELAEKIS